MMVECIHACMSNQQTDTLFVPETGTATLFCISCTKYYPIENYPTIICTPHILHCIITHYILALVFQIIEYNIVYNIIIELQNINFLYLEDSNQ